MGRRYTKASASHKVSTSRAPQTHPYNLPSSPSSSPSQCVALPAQQNTQTRKATRSTSASDWTSAFGLNQSETHRSSLSTLFAPERNTKPSQQLLTRKSTPASIMTSIHGVPMYSQGSSAQPSISTTPSATELQTILNKTRTPTPNNRTPSPNIILLPKLDPSLRSEASAYRSSCYARHIPPPHRQPSSENTTPQPRPPFDPAKCHWRALRDVAFVLDGALELSSEDLCALLRFRYARTDPQMAWVELAHVGPMYDFCKRWPKEMYELTAWNFIKQEMGLDLELMRDGGVSVVSEDF